MAVIRTSRLPAIGAAVLIAATTMPLAARAAIIWPTPTLPVLGVPYIPLSGAGCFPAAGVCIAGGSIELTLPVVESFNASGQHLTSGAVFTGQLTTLGNTPLGSLTLTGTIGQEVLGRTTSVQTGTFSTELTSLSLSGPALGHTLTLALDPGTPSTGQTSIDPIGEVSYLIGSFFDVFVEVSLDTPTPLETTRGPLSFTLTNPIPEPASAAWLWVPLLALTVMFGGRRRAGAMR